MANVGGWLLAAESRDAIERRARALQLHAELAALERSMREVLAAYAQRQLDVLDRETAADAEQRARQLWSFIAGTEQVDVGQVAATLQEAFESVSGRLRAIALARVDGTPRSLDASVREAVLALAVAQLALLTLSKLPPKRGGRKARAAEERPEASA